MYKKLLLFKLVLLLLSITLQAQDKVEAMRKKQMLHKESPADAWLPHPDQKGAVSKAYYYRDAMVETVQVNVDADGQNIIGDAANEPSISVDTANPNRMVIGWRQFDNIASNFRQAGFAFTNNGGQSWNNNGPINPGVFRSDPVVDIDSDGTFYYNSLTSNNGNYTCRVFRSYDGGATWDEGVEAKGGDKQWMIIDRTNGPGRNHNYSFWTMSWSSCYPGNFTRSVNQGDSYGPCVAVADEPYWGTLAVAPNGDLFIAGAGWSGIVVSKSSSAKDALLTPSWDFSTEVDMDGIMNYGPVVNPVGLLGQASIGIDHSDGPGSGNIYVLASVERYSGDPGDVMFARSIDGGLSWSAPQRINNDLSFSNTQWFGTMSVAPNGRIDVVWLDTRDAPPNLSRMSALYYSFSTDQGESWSPNQKISELFDPHIGWPSQNKMGDYFHMVSENDAAHLAWANTLNGGQDVYYSRISLDITGIDDTSADHLVAGLYPNPTNGRFTLSYQLMKPATVKLWLSDAAGRKVATLPARFQTTGTHSQQLDISGLQPGIYCCHISTETALTSLKVVVY